jgi:hypothetical protein
MQSITCFRRRRRLGHAIGRRAMLACNVIPSLARLFNDQEPSVRRNAHRAVSMYSEAPPGNND